MFAKGKVYTIRMADPSGVNAFTGPLLDVDLPLICIEFGNGHRIVNVNSPLFISADRADEETAAAIHQRHQANFLGDTAPNDAEPVDLNAAYEAHKDDPPAFSTYSARNPRR